MRETRVTLHDGFAVPVYCFDPSPPAKAVILIIHGAGEHGRRYSEFASFLARSGFAVLTYDQRGHGKNLNNQTSTHMGDTAQAQDLIEDVLTVLAWARGWVPHRPVFAIAHSMGAFVMRSVLHQQPDATDGTMLIGSSVFSAWQLRVVRQVAKGLRRFFGPTHVSGFLTRLTQDRPYKAMVKRGLITHRDEWVTHDEDIRTLAKNDPEIGVPFTITSQIVLMSLMLKAQQVHHLKHDSVTGHLAILCGDEDPVCDFGAGVDTLSTLYAPFCKQRILSRCYQGLRHEILQETVRETIFGDIRDMLEAWIDEESA